MSIRFFLGMFALATLVVGCQPEPDSEVTVEEGEPLFFEALSRGQSATTRDTVQTIVSTPEAWSRLAAQFRPMNPFPEVDFNQTMVGVISIPTESGGYSIQVESIEREDSTLTVDYVLNAPGNSCISPQALAEPFQVVTIRRVEFEDVIFRRRVEHYSCEVEQ